jgi:predicted homoserine dehydrogenase-like protein
VSLRRKLELLESAGAPIRVGLVGTGQMGRGFIAQVAEIPGMEIVAAADLDVEAALAAFREVGRDPVEGADGSRERPAVTADAADIARAASVDVVVEATGVPEVGARVAYEAIQNRKHIVMLNVETDVTVGAALQRMADAAGVVYTGSAGDEPGAIMELYDFARSLGFEVVVAGKGKNNPLDVSANPDSVAEEAERKRMNPKMLASFVDGTKTMVEMAAVANSIGFAPDVPGMHGPEETVPNRLPEIFSLEREGGILSRYSTVDYVRGVAPGVFVIVRSPEGPVRETLAYLGQGAGPNHVLYRPYHLTSLETPISVARAAIYGEPTITSGAVPTAEVVAVAKRDLAAGEKLGGIGGTDYYGHLYPVDAAAGLLPLGLAAGSRLTRDVPRGEAILQTAAELPQNSFVAALRRVQDLTLERTVA